jgi:hypothetical protein
VRTSQRVIILYADDADSADDVRHLLSAVASPPFHPLPDKANPRTVKQERWSEEEVDKYILTMVKRMSGKVHFAGALLGPDE